MVCRELTKTFESIHGLPASGDAGLARGRREPLPRRDRAGGGGASKEEEELPAEAIRTLGLLVAELPLKKAAALTAEDPRVKKNALYKYGLEHH